MQQEGVRGLTRPACVCPACQQQLVPLPSVVPFKVANARDQQKQQPIQHYLFSAAASLRGGGQGVPVVIALYLPYSSGQSVDVI